VRRSVVECHFGATEHVLFSAYRCSLLPPGLSGGAEVFATEPGEVCHWEDRQSTNSDFAAQRPMARYRQHGRAVFCRAAMKGFVSGWPLDDETALASWDDDYEYDDDDEKEDNNGVEIYPGGMLSLGSTDVDLTAAASSAEDCYNGHQHVDKWPFRASSRRTFDSPMPPQWLAIFHYYVASFEGECDDETSAAAAAPHHRPAPHAFRIALCATVIGTAGHTPDMNDNHHHHHGNGLTVRATITPVRGLFGKHHQCT
jgi:hypothetical protein